MGEVSEVREVKEVREVREARGDEVRSTWCRSSLCTRRKNEGRERGGRRHSHLFFTYSTKRLF